MKKEARKTQKFSAIVTSNHTNFGTKLSLDHVKKMHNSKTNLGFVLQKLCSSDSSKIIKYG